MRIFKNKEQRVIKVIEKAMPAVVSIAVSEKDKTKKSSSNHFSLEKADNSQDFASNINKIREKSEEDQNS